MGKFNIYRPIELHFQVTERCNFSCPWCYVQYGPSEEELTLEEVKKYIIEGIKPLMLLQVTLTGGEPFLRKDIFELVDNFNAIGLTTLIATHGMFLSEEMIEKLIASKLDEILVSLDSHISTVMDEIRCKPGIQQLVVHNLKNLIERVIATNSKLRVGVNIVAQERNASCLLDTVKFAVSLGVTRVNLQPMIPYASVYPDFNKGFKLPKISDESLRALTEQIKEIIRLRKEYKDSIGFPSEALLSQIPLFFKDPT